MSPYRTRQMLDRFKEIEGWTDEKLLELLIDFIDSTGQRMALENTLEAVAEIEDEGREAKMTAEKKWLAAARSRKA